MFKDFLLSGNWCSMELGLEWGGCKIIKEGPMSAAGFVVVGMCLEVIQEKIHCSSLEWNSFLRMCLWLRMYFIGQANNAGSSHAGSPKPHHLPIPHAPLLHPGRRRHPSDNQMTGREA